MLFQQIFLPAFSLTQGLERKEPSSGLFKVHPHTSQLSGADGRAYPLFWILW